MSKPNRDEEWKRRLGGVAWDDCWDWAQQIRDTWGLWTVVKLYPPIGSSQQPHGSLVVELQANVPGVGYVAKHLRVLPLPPPHRTTVPALVLQALVGMDAALDRELYEREREAGKQGGLPF